MTFGDVVDRAPVEGELLHTLSLLEAAFEATADGILVVDLTGRIVWFNQRFVEMWALPPPLLVDRVDAPVLAHVAAQVRDSVAFVARVEQLYREPQVESFDALTLKDGRVFERYSRPQRLRDQVVGRVWSFRDVTDRMRAEEESRLLQSLTTALREADDLASMLHVVLCKVCEATGWALGQAWLPAAHEAVLECGPAWARETAAVAPFRALSLRMRFLPRVGLPGRVWASRAPEWYRALLADGTFFRASVAHEVGLQAAVGFPVFARDEVVAVIEFLVNDPREVDERRMELVGAVAAQLGSVLDRKRAETALRESEARYRTLVEHAPEAILVLDTVEHRFVSVNENAVRLFGHARERFPSLGPLDVSAAFQPGGRASADAVRDRLRDAVQDGATAFEWMGRSATGREFPCEVRVVRLPGAGNPLVRATVTDITQRKRAEALRIGQTRVLEMVATGAPLADTLEHLVHIIESQSEGMIGSVLLLDEEGRHLRHGAAPGLPEAYNRAIDGEAIGPSAGSCGTAAYRNEPVIVGDIQTDPLWAEYRHLAAAYGLRACWSTPIRSYTGKVLGTFAMYYREPRVPGPEDTPVIAIATHLAGIAIERRRAEETLRRDAAEIEDLYENAPCGYHSLDRDGRIVRMNRTELTWLGFARDEVVGKKRIEDLLAPQGWIDLQARLAGDVDHDRNIELEMVRKDGTRLPVVLGVTVVRDARGAVVISRAVVMDDTERKRAEQALRESERTYRALYTRTPAMLHSTDRRGRILSVSDDWLASLGYERSEVIGRRSVDFLVPGSVRHGARIAFSRGRTCKDVPYRFVKKDGQIMDVLLSSIAERDAQGRIVRNLAVLVDVTARKRAEEELQLYRSHLEELVAARTRKLDALNQELEAFCYSVSHDLRAPLRSIDGFSQIVLEDYAGGLDARGRQHLARIRASTRQMAQLIDDLLNLSRVSRGELRVQPVDLSSLARKAADLLVEAAPDRKVDVVIQEGVRAEGDPHLLRVVLENLLGNAWKFTSKHARARIEFGCFEQDGHAVYYVRDDGAGFDMAYVDKLFSPFQRLHSPSEFEGTGIGLATVQRVIQRHGGRIWAEGAVGQGATFYFTL